MATRNISLTAQQDAFVTKLVKSGEYQNASEAMRDALRVLKAKRREDELRLKQLRLELAKGLADLERGAYDTVEVKDLPAYLRSLGTRKR